MARVKLGEWEPTLLTDALSGERELTQAVDQESEDHKDIRLRNIQGRYVLLRMAPDD